MMVFGSEDQLYPAKCLYLRGHGEAGSSGHTWLDCMVDTKILTVVMEIEAAKHNSILAIMVRYFVSFLGINFY